MRFRFLLVLGLMASPLMGARLAKLELTVLPRSGGKILVDVRGEVEEATPSSPLTVLFLEGLRQPVVKFHSPDGWRWQRKVDGVSLRVAIPPGRHEFSLQVEGLPTGALRVLSDLPARSVRVFLPESWDFPAKPVDQMEFSRHILAVYEVAGNFPLVIPLGKGKPLLFFLIAGGVFLLALVTGSLVFFRRRRSAPSLPEEEEEEEEEEEADLETPAEVEPEEEDTGGVPEVIQPVQRSVPSEPSVMNDPLAALGVIPGAEEGEEEETPEGASEIPPGEADALPDLGAPESEDEKLRKLAREVGIPAEEPLPEEVPGFPSTLEEEEGPVSIEEQLLAEKGEARSVEAELLGEDVAPSLPSFEEETVNEKPEEPPGPSPEVTPPEPEEGGLFAGVSPSAEKVEASPADMLDMADLPGEVPEEPEPEEPAPMSAEEEDLRVEVDEAFLAGAEEDGGEEATLEPVSEGPASPPSPPASVPAPPETKPSPDAPSSPRDAQADVPSRDLPKPQPEPPQRPPSPVRKKPASSSPAPPGKPAPKPPSRPAPPSPPPERTSPPSPRKPAGTSPQDREALIREWLMKRKRRKKS